MYKQKQTEEPAFYVEKESRNMDRYRLKQERKRAKKEPRISRDSGDQHFDFQEERGRW